MFILFYLMDFILIQNKYMGLSGKINETTHKVVNN